MAINRGQGAGANRSVNSIVANRRRRNKAQQREQWQQQAWQEKNFKNALGSFALGLDQSRKTAAGAFGNARNTLQGFGNYLTDQRQQGMDRIAQGWGDARNQLQPRAQREEGLYNWLRATMSPLAHEQFATDVTSNEGFDQRAAKDARSVLNARGMNGVQAQAAIEEARFQSAAQREAMERAAMAQAQGIGTNLWQDSVAANNRISDLYTSEATTANNYGQAYDAFKGQNNTLLAQNDLNSGLFQANADMALGNANMGFWDKTSALSQENNNWARNADYQIDNWGANAQLQDYMMQQQLAAAKESQQNQMWSSLLSGGVNLLTAGTGGGFAGALGKSFFS